MLPSANGLLSSLAVACWALLMPGTVKIVKARAVEATFERVFFLMDLDPFVGIVACDAIVLVIESSVKSNGFTTPLSFG